jgi:hypothetical protein
MSYSRLIRTGKERLATAKRYEKLRGAGWSVADICSEFPGSNQSEIYCLLQIVKLPSEIQEDIHTERLTINAAKKLCSLSEADRDKAMTVLRLLPGYEQGKTPDRTLLSAIKTSSQPDAETLPITLADLVTKTAKGENLTDRERSYILSHTEKVKAMSVGAESDTVVGEVTAALSALSGVLLRMDERAMRICENCQWFREDHEVEESSFSMGFCHRKAPAPSNLTEADDEARQAEWPFVRSDDFCGDFQP